MSIPGAASPLFLTTAAAADAAAFQIDRSLRFNSGDSSKLTRTFSASNRKTFTYSCWVKRAQTGTKHSLFHAGSTYYRFDSGDDLYFYHPQGNVNTDAVFRDPSAWYHIVLAVDTTQSTAANRVKIYVNGTLASLSGTYPNQDVNVDINSAAVHTIGSQSDFDVYLNGYLAEIHFVDGQALAPTDFGEYDDNNVWQPKEVSVSSINDGTDWSDGWDSTNINSSFPGTNSFDGSLTTKTLPNNDTTATWTPSSGIDIGTSLRIYGRRETSGGTLNFNFSDSTTSTITISTTTTWYEVSGAAGKTLTSVVIGKDSSGNEGIFHALEVDGEILVDSYDNSSGYGTNGFHLKFADNSSNSALGTDSSGNSNTWNVHNLTAQEFTATFLQGNTSHLSGTAFNNSHALAHLFDSDKTNTMAASGNSTIVYSPSPAITADSFRIHYQLDSSLSGFGLKVNDVDYTSSLSVGSNKQIDINVQTLNKVEIRTDSSNQWLSLYYIEKLTSASGPGQDSLLDTPTNYTADSGNNGGNYCTLSPLKNSQTLSNGNLDVVGGSSWQRSVGTIGMYSGKYYWEYTITASDEHLIGVGPPDMQLSGNLGAGDPPGSGYGTELGFVNGTGANGSWSNTGASGAGDVIGIAFDADNGSMYVYKNGTALNSGAASHTGLVMPQIPVVSLNGSSRSGTINFGQRPFAYTPPTGYVSLCTENLSESAYASIPDGSTAFDTTLYSGNDTQRDITGLGFSPDLVWIKKRQSGNHSLMDTVRGATKNLVPNDTQGEGTEAQYLNAFLSDGFSLGTSGVVNDGSSTYVAWTWDAGTSAASSNTDGSITSSVRANASAGISIVSWTGRNGTVGHGLNDKPGLILTKIRNSSSIWPVQHSAIGTNILQLESTAASASDSSNRFNATEPTNSVFTAGTWWNSDSQGIAYCFAPVEGFSAFGSYTGNGSTDGPFVYTGMRPRWLLIKRTDAVKTWQLMDTARDPINPADTSLFPAEPDAESGNNANYYIDILSNGFKIRTSHNSRNASGGTYIYAAFAEHPFKTARAR